MGLKHGSGRAARRGNGQDRLAVVPSSGGLVVVVADGAGGTAGGAEAADHVIDGATGPPRADPVGVLRDLDRAIHDDPVAGETTAVFVVVSDERLVGASVGDSIAWLVTADAIVDLTASQSSKPLLGRGDARPASFEATLGTGTLIVASDGLAKYVPRDSIGAMARGEDLDAAATWLLELARLRNGELQDDVSVVLVRAEA